MSEVDDSKYTKAGVGLALGVSMGLVTGGAMSTTSSWKDQDSQTVH